MPKVDQWAVIHAERTALAADLDGLAAEKWTTMSLCNDWTVQQVLAHMTATAKMTPPKFFGQMIGAGFKFEKIQVKNIAAEIGDAPEATLAAFKAEINSTKHPPGPTDSWLGEVIVHSHDIRQPLGIAHEYDKNVLMHVADFYKGSNLIIGAKKRVAGLKLSATDADWTTGDGPEVSGPIASLVFAMVGRKVVLDGLSGDGVAEFRSRP